jgi:membrane-associated protease RseP (regulator of RpoE activity)
VGLVRPNFPAAKAGIEPGDRITAVGSRPVANWSELKRLVMAAAPGAVTLRVVTGSDSRDVEANLQSGEEMTDVLGVTRPSPVVTGFAKGSDAGSAGVEVGDTLLAFHCRDPKSDDAEAETKKTAAPTDNKDLYGGRRFDRVPPVRQLIFPPGTNPAKKPKPLNILIERAGEKHVVKVTPVLGKCGRPGVSARIETCRVVPSGSMSAAFVQSGKETAYWVALAGRTLWMLVTGRFSADMVSGPVGIFAVSRSQAEVGFLSFIEFMVIITVHLGVINLVPFPILDGGHLAFLAVEKIRRKPCPEKMMAGLMYTGMLCLVALMLFVTWNDLWKIWLSRVFG